jgi:hypothetical protein
MGPSCARRRFHALLLIVITLASLGSLLQIQSTYATDAFGNGDANTITYVDPSFIVLPDGSYQYTTSFGVYTITYRPILNLYSVAYTASDGTPLVTASAYALLDDSSADWKFLRAEPLKFIISSPTVTTTNTRFEADWTLTWRPTSQQLGSISFIIDYQKSAYPKQSVHLSLDSYQLDPSCVGNRLCN